MHLADHGRRHQVRGDSQVTEITINLIKRLGDEKHDGHPLALLLYVALCPVKLRLLLESTVKSEN